MKPKTPLDHLFDKHCALAGDLEFGEEVVTRNGLDAILAALTAPAPADAAEREVERSFWALCYLHDWDPVREDGTQPIFPEIHRVYRTEAEAFAAQRNMKNAERYWVRRAHLGEFKDGKDQFAALNQTTEPEQSDDR